MKPRKNEQREQFLARFMKEQERNYPNQAYRYVVAIGVWEENKNVKVSNRR